MTGEEHAWRELILEHAPKKECLRILDVGTGPGFFAINLALAGHKVTAIDVTEHMIWHAKQKCRKLWCRGGPFWCREESSYPLRHGQL